jgi:chemotaxis protein CheZ
MAKAALRTTKSSLENAESVVLGTKPGLDVEAIMRELASVADYIGHIKNEIGSLKAHELSNSRIPMAHNELGSVINATESASNAIMSAAEEILGNASGSIDEYRAEVETKLLEIFEACAFQDITSQRITKVIEALGQIEKRLARFANAVNARDAMEGPDPEEALKQARREMLILNGPQLEGNGVNQNDIDSMFD